MGKVVGIVNWAALALFLVSIGMLHRFNPNAVTGTHFVVLLPFASGLLAAYKPSEKAVVVACVSVNAMYLLLSTVLVTSVLTGWGAYPTGAIVFFGILGMVPASLNVFYGCTLL